MSDITLRLYDTLTKTKVPLTPAIPGKVRMYVCGPTVYDYAHIGNARPVIVFDVLFRLLRHAYGADNVVYARNITDVDDKINARAARDHPGLPLNEAIAKVTAATEAQFHADIRALGVLMPDDVNKPGCAPAFIEPRATEHIDQMRQIIERLVARGVAYVAEGHVLFSPKAMEEVQGRPRYGSLARRSLDEMLAGARVDVAPYKRDPMDFVLWKPSKEGEPGWPAPCGIEGLGRPGWHIECSAMSMAKLLEPFGGGLECDDPSKNVFDIHGGGIDLVFPHHENEIAQSCCAFGAERMANIWMHNGFLQVEGEKMSKSAGNFVTIHELLHTDTFGGRSWPGEVLRLAMLKTHYRQPIDWTVKALEEAENKLVNWSVNKWFDVLDDEGNSIEPTTSEDYEAELVRALSNDLNTWEAMRVIDKALKSNVPYEYFKNLVLMIGVDLEKFSRSYSDNNARQLAASMSDIDEAQINTLINARLEARRATNFAESDRIRDELVAMGIQIMDAKDPVTGELSTTWQVKR